MCINDRESESKRMFPLKGAALLMNGSVIPGLKSVSTSAAFLERLCSPRTPDLTPDLTTCKLNHRNCQLQDDANEKPNSAKVHLFKRGRLHLNSGQTHTPTTASASLSFHHRPVDSDNA